MLRPDKDNSLHILQPPLSEYNVPMGCLDHRFRLRRSVHRNLLQSHLRLQAPCSKLGPDLASDSDMRQPRVSHNPKYI
jgi:hypothetical protein